MAEHDPEAMIEAVRGIRDAPPDEECTFEEAQPLR